MPIDARDPFKGRQFPGEVIVSTTPVSTVRVRYSKSTPRDCHPGALAYTNPFAEAPEITVFYDRIRLLADSRPAYEPRLLAHVLAHEIGQVLQQNDAHSESGVMKVHWSAEDLESMGRRPSPFTEADRRLILTSIRGE